MKLDDILKIVLLYAKNLIHERDLAIHLTVKSQIDLPVKEHYYLVSILSNILTNCIDALEDQTQGTITILIEEKEKNILFRLSDNGPGIPFDIQPLIFQPGFSTKFNTETGDIYRGIGLAHVKIIVKEKFNGSIALNTSKKDGTEFLLLLDKKSLMLGENR